MVDSLDRSVAKPAQFDQEEYGAEHGREVARAICGPGVAGIAWMPFFPNRESLPGCELKDHPLAHTGVGPRHAIPEILRSGNHRPKEQIRGAEEFSRELLLLDYRAAFAIVDPILYVDSEQRPCRFTFRHFSRVGYTPVRIGGTTKYSPGIGSFGPRSPTRFESNGVALEYTIRFRLGWFANLVGKMMTHHLGSVCFDDGLLLAYSR